MRRFLKCRWAQSGKPWRACNRNWGTICLQLLRSWKRLIWVAPKKFKLLNWPNISNCNCLMICSIGCSQLTISALLLKFLKTAPNLKWYWRISGPSSRNKLKIFPLKHLSNSPTWSAQSLTPQSLQLRYTSCNYCGWEARSNLILNLQCWPWTVWVVCLIIGISLRAKQYR